MSIDIIKAGPLTTIQDLGRWRYQSQGIPVSGAMDADAFIHANMLLGNDNNDPCLEISSGNIELKFSEHHVIALTGAGTKASIDSKEIPFNRPIFIQANVLLKLSARSNGMWTYLSVGGKLDIKEILKSNSTYLPSGFGGWEGRRLKNGDNIQVKNFLIENYNWMFPKILTSNSFTKSSWSIEPNLSSSSFIRIFPGKEWDWLDQSSKAMVETNFFSIQQDSNRMGYRLSGEKLKKMINKEMISDAVAKGTIQLTNEGNLIVLMADGQTVGGYPRMAQVAAVDLPKLAQKGVGESIQFKLISYHDAEQLFLNREHERRQLETALRIKKQYGNRS